MDQLSPFAVYWFFTLFGLFFLSIIVGVLFYFNNGKQAVPGLVGGFFFLLSCLLVGNGFAYLLESFAPVVASLSNLALLVILYSLLHLALTWVPSLAFGFRFTWTSRLITVLASLVCFTLIPIFLVLAI
jgi:hypothetical protein